MCSLEHLLLEDPQQWLRIRYASVNTQVTLNMFMRDPSVLRQSTTLSPCRPSAAPSRLRAASAPDTHMFTSFRRR